MTQVALKPAKVFVTPLQVIVLCDLRAAHAQIIQYSATDDAFRHATALVTWKA